MKLRKKIFIGLTSIIACLSISAVSAFANTSTTNAKGYGTLTGTLSSTSTTAYYGTTVTENTDNAYLTIAGSVQDKNGKTLVSKQQINSSRGAVGFYGTLSPLPDNAYVVYGTHGVQGGSKYGAAAVYTYTHI